VSVRSAPRIDPRLRQFIVGSPFFASPAEVTRATGELAWSLGLARPSYQQVRELMGGANRPVSVAPSVQTSRGRVVLRHAVQFVDHLYEYPGPFLGDWYLRYKRGLV
jgi:hypothetical protein